MIGILFGAVSLSGVDVPPDLRKIDPAVIFRADASTASPLGAPVAEVSKVAPLSVFIRLAADDDALPDQVRNLGGSAWKVLPRIWAAALPADGPRYLSNRPSVRYIEADRVARPMLDLSRPAVSADLVQQGPPSLPQSFRGEGTFVGIVDTGLDGDHPDFTGRIVNTFAPSHLNLNSLEDTNGHGTHVTGIAAGDGSASSGAYTGMAPGASLLIGRAGRNDFQTSDILAAINNLLVFAGATPVAINLSLGLTHGPHDGTSSFEAAVDSVAADAAGSRGIITVSAGNERGFDEHFHATVPPFGLTTLAVSFAEGTTNAEVEIWADGEDEYSVTVTMGGNSVTAPSRSSRSESRISISNKMAVQLNGDTLISVFFEPLTGTTTATIQLTRTRNGGTGTVDGYIDIILDGTFQDATDTGIVTEPANADHVIAVGSFNTKQHPGGQRDFAEGISEFSSLGPTRDGRIKPDLAAPGSVIYSTRSSDAPPSNFSFGVVDNNDNYAILAGTSMATAHVTGIAAIVWQSNPALTGAQMRERLKLTADPPSDRSDAPNNTWGYGKVNAFRAVTEPVASISAPGRTTPNTQVTLTSENSSGPLGAAISYEWNGVPGGSSTTFQEPVPGDYSVSLVVTSNGTTSLTDTRTIRVNHVPIASISGPTAVDNITSVPFTGTGSDPDDGQTLSFHWILVERPVGSLATLSTANVDTVTLVPDVSGTYELGLRVNDGLDDSGLATRRIDVAVPSSSDAGGGGCSVRFEEGAGEAASDVAALFLLLAPLGVLWSVKRAYRLPRR